MFSKCLLFFASFSFINATQFTCGFASYDSLKINASAITTNGSFFELVASGTTDLGPIVFGTFTYSNTNPVSPPLTSNLLASFLLNGQTIVPQSLYGFNGTLGQFDLTPSQNQQNLSFVENTGSQISLKMCAISNSSGKLLASPVFVQLNPQGTYTQISGISPSGDNLIYSYIINTTPTGTCIMLNSGTKNGFSNNPYYVGNFNSNPQTLYLKPISGGAINLWDQNFYNQEGISYSQFKSNNASLPKNLSDSQTNSIDFFLTDSSSPYLFYSEETNYGPKLNAIYVSQNGQVKKYQSLLQSYNYSPFQGASLSIDGSGNFYLLFNGTSQAYLAPFNVSINSFSQVITAPLAMYSYTQLYDAEAYLNTLLLSAVNSPSGPSYDYNICFYNPTNQTFTPSLTVTSSTATYSSGLEQSIIYNTTPLVSYAYDNFNNIIFTYSSLTSIGQYQLFSNVYSATIQNLLGQNAISISPYPMGTPQLLSNGTTNLLVWTEYNGTYYQIFTSSYQPQNQTFGTPTTLNYNFTTEPQIIPNPEDPLGFIFAGTN